MAKGSWGGSRPGSGRPLKGTSKRQKISVTLPSDQLVAIDQVASARGVSKSEALSIVLALGLTAMAGTPPSTDP